MATEWLLGLLKNSLKRDLKGWAKVGLFAGPGIAFYLHKEKTVGGFTTVTGPSMQPTLNNYISTTWNDKGTVSTGGYSNPIDDWVYYKRDFVLGRGDVVILKNPKGTGKLVKRVIGLAGDTITPLGFNNIEQEPLTLGEGQIWVESDQQRFGYNDSNKFGPVSQQLVEAKVTYLLGTFESPWGKNIESVLPESAGKRLKVAGQAQ